tara:strand:+ start:47 stop:286 length:240 start_codon:yes stop_codon:yes gene_type:complete
MKAPKIPSFFKSKSLNVFSFQPRYYDQKKERRKQLKKEGINQIKFKRINRNNRQEKGRTKRIIYLLIILSLLTYQLIYN